MGGLIGRLAESEAVDAFLSAVSTPPDVLALVADPGMGKTTLWGVAVSAAAAIGYRVLSCRPAAAEAQLAYSGLGDLLHDVVDEALDSLPPPQRDALSVALLLADPGGRPASERSVAVAFLTALRRIAADRPVLIAVDDLQWLDEETVHVLEYARRRLDGEPVKMLVALRNSGDDGCGRPCSPRPTVTCGSSSCLWGH